jgi:hypothetical protein
MPQADTFHGFMLYVIVGGVAFPIWGPVMMVLLTIFLVGLIVYGFIFAPIRWFVIGIRRGDWDLNNFQWPARTRQKTEQ